MVRSLKATVTDRSIVVAFKAGEYHEENITMTAEDSGTKEHPVIYCGYGDGVFYALTMSAVNAKLVTINTTTGALTEIGATGKPCYYAQSMTCDVETGIIYWAHLESNYTNGLYTIDRETAQIESLGKIGSDGMEIMGLYIVPENEPVVPPTYTLGDVDNNGQINVTDATLALRAAMGLMELSETQQLAADVNFGGSVDVGDALLILRRAMGLINEF